SDRCLLLLLRALMPVLPQPVAALDEHHDEQQGGGKDPPERDRIEEPIAEHTRSSWRTGFQSYPQRSARDGLVLETTLCWRRTFRRHRRRHVHAGQRPASAGHRARGSWPGLRRASLSAAAVLRLCLRDRVTDEEACLMRMSARFGDLILARGGRELGAQ